MAEQDSISFARLEERICALHEDVRDIKTWTDRHEAQHLAMADASKKTGERVAALEGTVAARSAIGGIGIVISWLAAALGIAQK